MSRGPNSNNGHVRWWCLCDCGNGILATGSSLVEGNTKSCGCLKIERRLRRVGENSPNWKGGVSSKNDLIRASKKYKEWRIQVFKQDNDTCQKCGQFDVELSTHHIEGFAGNPELRVEVSNGVTLCEECHKDFHHQYGYRNSTRLQFESWLEVN